MYILKNGSYTVGIVDFKAWQIQDSKQISTINKKKLRNGTGKIMESINPEKH